MSLALKPNTLPADASVPTNPQRLLNWIVQHINLKGQAGTISFVSSDTTPPVSDRDKLWLKLDNLGNPLAVYRYKGSWVRLGSYANVGATADRPVSPEAGQTFYDTDIGANLIFVGGSWRTVDGVSGDTKLVRAASTPDALTANPGWVEDDDYATHTGATLTGDIVALKKA